MRLDEYFHPRTEYSMLIAAIGHDLGHPGVNNPFLTASSHELAIRYNDQSPLENMHCAKLYTILGVKEQNVFSNFSREEYKDSRKACIDSILHSDMAHHMSMVKELDLLAQLNSEVFSEESIGKGLSKEEKEVFNKPQNKSLMLKCLLHSADVSNPCRPWDVTVPWADACLAEFFDQGDQEKSLGMPVGMLNDRLKVNRPNSQISFVEFMIAPLFAACARLWPGMSAYSECCGENISSWEKVWVEGFSPAEEDQAKLTVRVQKVKNNLMEAEKRKPKVAI